VRAMGSPRVSLWAGVFPAKGSPVCLERCCETSTVDSLGAIGTLPAEVAGAKAFAVALAPFSVGE